MSEMTATQRPLPQPTVDSAAYWQAAREGRLVIQKCSGCGRRQFYPRAFCTACLSADLEWTQASGLGRVYSFTICRVAASAAFEARVPYAVAMVDLDEGVRLLANIVECDIERIAIGAPVRVHFESLGDGFALPQFTLAA